MDDEDFLLDDIFPSKVTRQDRPCSGTYYKKHKKSISDNFPPRPVHYETAYRVKNPTRKTEKEPMTNKVLYKADVNGKLEYVTLIGQDGNKQVVKTQTGELVAVDHIEEVLPDTVSVQFLDGSFRGSKVYQYMVDNLDDWSVGMLVIPQDSANIAKVVEVDTKSKAATKRLKGVVLLTKEV